MKLNALLLCASVLFVSSCVSTDQLTKSSDLTVNEAISSAEMARKKVAKVGYEWRDTGKLIKKAKVLVGKGKNKDAMVLALKAKEQSEIAFNQYQSESSRFATNH